jgi:hypothetical protein
VPRPQLGPRRTGRSGWADASSSSVKNSVSGRGEVG